MPTSWELNDAGQHYHILAGRGHLTIHNPNTNSVRNLHSLFCIGPLASHCLGVLISGTSIRHSLASRRPSPVCVVESQCRCRAGNHASTVVQWYSATWLWRTMCQGVSTCRLIPLMFLDLASCALLPAWFQASAGLLPSTMQAVDSIR